MGMFRLPKKGVKTKIPLQRKRMKRNENSSSMRISISVYRMYIPKLENSVVVYATNLWTIQGRLRRNTTNTAMALGTNARVASWIEVTTWRMLIAIPTTIPTTNMGVVIISRVSRDCLARFISNASDILLLL
jgi:hypothetical protein